MPPFGSALALSTLVQLAMHFTHAVSYYKLAQQDALLSFVPTVNLSASGEESPQYCFFSPC